MVCACIMPCLVLKLSNLHGISSTYPFKVMYCQPFSYKIFMDLISIFFVIINNMYINILITFSFYSAVLRRHIYKIHEMFTKITIQWSVMQCKMRLLFHNTLTAGGRQKWQVIEQANKQIMLCFKAKQTLF